MFAPGQEEEEAEEEEEEQQSEIKDLEFHSRSKLSLLFWKVLSFH